MADITAACGQLHKSLTGKTSDYLVVQLRPLDPYSVRLQFQQDGGNFYENGFKISDDLYNWMKGKLPLTNPSLAGTGAKYALALARLENSVDPKAGTDEVRFQIPGPAHNRSVGAVFIITHGDIAANLKARMSMMLAEKK